jgi:histidinol phosphatase-like PHP family hydrolase
MKLDRNVMDLMSLLEKSCSRLTSYTFIPQLIREEIKEIRFVPRYERDDEGGLLNILIGVEVEYYEKKAVA